MTTPKNPAACEPAKDSPEERKKYTRGVCRFCGSPAIAPNSKICATGAEKLANNKNPAAVAMGKLGGAAKHPRKGFGSMTPERREEIAAKIVATKRAKATAAAPTPAKPGPTA